MHPYRVAPGRKVDLGAHDPRATRTFDGDKEAAAGELERLNAKLEELQELLWADGRHKLLVVLQAMDAGGKDGTIRRVLDGVNPQGVKVASFKAPTADELARDYLWRIHARVPARGEIVIFNRSHYEDVLAVRVRRLAPEAVWRPRYEQINAFEKLLAEEGTTILKFFLHISKDEQGRRLEARRNDPRKRWKFREQDLEDRALWDDYMKAYAAALSRTSTEWAPWYVVPADRKWYRDLVISRLLVETLERLELRYPG
jgi:PPK2 family polyphosphate:nucleotide phosphotransferase